MKARARISAGGREVELETADTVPLDALRTEALALWQAVEHAGPGPQPFGFVAQGLLPGVDLEPVFFPAAAGFPLRRTE